jgi:site-specific recombinase XerD
MNQLLEETILRFDRFLGLYLSPVTCKGETGRLRRFLRHVLSSGRDYRSVAKEEIESFLSSLNGGQDNRAMCAHTIKRFYNYLYVKQIIAENPAAHIHLPFPKRKSLTVAPTMEAVKGILNKLERDTTPEGLRRRLIVELAYGSGLRRTELAVLDREDIDLAEQTARVLGKGNIERVVPLSRRCMPLLNDRLKEMQPQNALFINKRNGRITPGTIGAVIKRSTGLNPHAFRHACATHMLLNGCNIRHIQELLGHKNINTTQTYTKLDKEDLRKVINAKHPGRLLLSQQ